MKISKELFSEFTSLDIGEAVTVPTLGVLVLIECNHIHEGDEEYREFIFYTSTPDEKFYRCVADFFPDCGFEHYKSKDYFQPVKPVAKNSTVWVKDTEDE